MSSRYRATTQTRCHICLLAMPLAVLQCAGTGVTCASRHSEASMALRLEQLAHVMVQW
jgi:hypothetical protein